MNGSIHQIRDNNDIIKKYSKFQTFFIEINNLILKNITKYNTIVCNFFDLMHLIIFFKLH